MLEARDIGVRYGDRWAVHGVSLRVEPGQIVAIAGPNGAGKTSLLRALNAAVETDTGSVLVDQRPLKSYSRRDIARRLSVVAQEAELRFPVTVLEFVLGGRYAWSTIGAWGWETEEDVAAATDAMQDCELTEFADRLMNELSGGERQRAVLARALATGATNLLLDEPTANLDLAHQATVLRLVRNRCNNQKVAAVVVTHDLNLAAEFGDAILLMKDGEMVSFGPPFEVFTPEILSGVFGIEVLVDLHPISGAPRITPVHRSWASVS
ncbi:MAG: ABC transporter ATP-binding protein [Pyrinomonadaceae bacterium]